MAGFGRCLQIMKWSMKARSDKNLGKSAKMNLKFWSEVYLFFAICAKVLASLVLSALSVKVSAGGVN